MFSSSQRKASALITFTRGDHEFNNEFAAADANLSRALGEAIGRVREVRVTANHARLISSICVEAEVLGHRADVVIDHAARALAAYRRHGSPSREDIYDAATLALAHRARQPLRRDQDDTTSPESGEEQEGSQKVKLRRVNLREALEARQPTRRHLRLDQQKRRLSDSCRPRTLVPP